MIYHDCGCLYIYGAYSLRVFIAVIIISLQTKEMN